MTLSFKRLPGLFILLCLAASVAGCSRSPIARANSSAPDATPAVATSAATVNTLSLGGESSLLDTVDQAELASVLEGEPTKIVPDISDQQPTATPQMFEEISIYDEGLADGWTLANSRNIAYTLWDTSHWFEPLDKERSLDTGGVVLAATPSADFSTLYFTIAPTATVQYSRDTVLGVSLWLNSGKDFMDTDDLAIAVIGSNANPFWTLDDRSALQGNQDFFSETRLYYLDVNRAIPPETWFNVVVWLDDLMFDPDYEYITGLYLKSDAGFQRTYFVDKVALIKAP